MLGARFNRSDNINPPGTYRNQSNVNLLNLPDFVNNVVSFFIFDFCSCE